MYFLYPIEQNYFDFDSETQSFPGYFSDPSLQKTIKLF